MKKLEKIYFDMMLENIIETEKITKDEYDKLIDNPEVIVLKKFTNNQEGAHQSIVYLKANKKDIDQDLVNQYIHIKNYENLAAIRSYLLFMIIAPIILFMILLMFALA